MIYKTLGWLPPQLFNRFEEVVDTFIYDDSEIKTIDELKENVHYEVVCRESHFPVPAIAVPHQFKPVIWWERPLDNSDSDGSDLHAILDSEEQARRYVKEKGHNYEYVEHLILDAWPPQKRI
jgi:hypothetical protein